MRALWAILIGIGIVVVALFAIAGAAFFTIVDDAEVKMADDEFEKTAILVNEPQLSQNLEVDLIRVGKYHEIDNLILTNGFRLDLEMENISSEDAITPSNIVLLDGDGNRFEAAPWHDGSKESDCTPLGHNGHLCQYITDRKILPGAFLVGPVFIPGFTGDSTEATILVTQDLPGGDHVFEWNVDLR